MLSKTNVPRIRNMWTGWFGFQAAAGPWLVKMSSLKLVCMQTLCALVSHDDAKQEWLQSTAILALLQRLTMQDPLTPEAAPMAPHPILASLGESTPLGIWRQSARIIAMISADASSQSMIG